MGAAAIPLALVAAGSGVNYLNQRRVNKAQERAATANIRRQERRDQEAAAAIEAQLGETARGPGDERKQLEADFQRQLRANRAQADASLGGTPQASERFKEDLAGRVVSGDARSSKIARLMADVDAAGLQRRREGRGRAGLATDIEQLARFAEGDDYTTRLRIENTRANPWVKLAAEAMKAYGSWQAGQAMGAGGKGAGFKPTDVGGDFTRSYSNYV